MMRVEETISKRHGAFKIFMARFRDAMFEINVDDLEAIKHALLQSGSQCVMLVQN